jgi:nucleoside-diphosphate-sugar epimerase
MADQLSILVTGGAGYLGSMMVPELLHQGHRVTVLDNFMYRQNSLTTVCADPNFQVVKGDAREGSVLETLVKDADLVIPLAALVGMPLCATDRIGAVAINRDAIITLLRLLAPSQRIIMPITNSGYGIGEKGKFCTEGTPLRPISLYGQTKAEAEAAVLDRGNAISFRLATVFGMAPRMRLDLLVNDFVYRAMHDRSLVLFEAHFRRNFVHVRDVARAFLHGIANFEAMRDNAYNVGLSDTNISKLELCHRIKRHLPLFVFPEAAAGEDPDRRDYIVSNAKMEAAGFQCAHSLDRGIVELIKGYAMIRNSVYGNV